MVNIYGTGGIGVARAFTIAQKRLDAVSSAETVTPAGKTAIPEFHLRPTDVGSAEGIAGKRIPRSLDDGRYAGRSRCLARVGRIQNAIRNASRYA